MPKLIKISSEHRNDEIFECHSRPDVEQAASSISCRSKSVPASSRRGFFTTLLTIVLIALLVSLGRWQLRRAEEKRALFDSFAAGDGRHARPSMLRRPPLRRYQHVEAGGRYDQTRQILIDNMVNGERVGYFVITPFALAGGGWVLVNRGWVPLDGEPCPTAGHSCRRQ